MSPPCREGEDRVGSAGAGAGVRPGSYLFSHPQGCIRPLLAGETDIPLVVCFAPVAWE